MVIEVAGSAQTLSQWLAAAGRGGTIVQVGTLPPSVRVPQNRVMALELNRVGSFRFANAFQTSIDLLTSRRIDIQPLVTCHCRRRIPS